MNEPNWGLIRSGATFEALVRTLVGFEDPQAVLLGRPGQDGGQDIRSGDGTRVFQAKFHEKPSSAKAIADAKAEIKKVIRYREPGHKRHGQWNDVTHWTLVTNTAFNPTDQERWDKEVVPEFKKAGLTAEFWGECKLECLLDKHREVERSFFGGEVRAFLSIAEARERMIEEEPFLRRETLGNFCGREADLKWVRAFLESNRLFLVVHGEGGVGKTRLLLEAGEVISEEGDWQVLWANVETMTNTSTWFSTVVRERPTLLLVDEPRDEALLRTLVEQLGGL